MSTIKTISYALDKRKRKLLIVLLFIALSGLLVISCTNKQEDKEGKPQEVKPGTKIIVEMRTGGGWAPLPEEQIMPDLRLYEDGTVVYKRYLKPPDRSKFELMIGHLAKSEASELLDFIADQGFFEMKDYYYGGIMDGADITVTVRTEERSKTVLVQGFGASTTDIESFERTWKRLSEFKVPFARKYRPERITLFVSSP